MLPNGRALCAVQNEDKDFRGEKIFEMKNGRWRSVVCRFGEK